jgi:hypothetical protein
LVTLLVLADWLIVGLVGLLVDWWVGCLVGWVIGCLNGWLVGRSGTLECLQLIGQKNAQTSSLHFHLTFEGRKLSKIYAQCLSQKHLACALETLQALH